MCARSNELTNAKRISNNSRLTWHQTCCIIRVTLADQSTYEAKVVGFNQDKDVAVLCINAPKEKPRPIPVGISADLLVGQKVFAIGDPLLCKYERNSVLTLEIFDNYRLEHCLCLCQEYGVIDAAAFLLERAGDVESALGLAMTDLHKKIDVLVTAVEDKFSEMISSTSAEKDHLTSVLRKTGCLCA